MKAVLIPQGHGPLTRRFLAALDPRSLPLQLRAKGSPDGQQSFTHRSTWVRRDLAGNCDNPRQEGENVASMCECLLSLGSPGRALFLPTTWGGYAFPSWWPTPPSTYAESQRSDSAPCQGVLRAGSLAGLEPTPGQGHLRVFSIAGSWGSPCQSRAGFCGRPWPHSGPGLGAEATLSKTRCKASFSGR